MQFVKVPCTMDAGARLIVNSDGTATFDATVNGGGGVNEVTLVQIELLDEHDAIIGDLTSAENPSPSGRHANFPFRKLMPLAGQRYRWVTGGMFDRSWYGIVSKARLSLDCLSQPEV